MPSADELRREKDSLQTLLEGCGNLLPKKILHIRRIDLMPIGGGKFETGRPATWEEGDWNLDGIFDTKDIIAALGAGLFETGPYAAGADGIDEDVASVPEPLTLTMATTAFLMFLFYPYHVRRHRMRP